MKLKCTNCLGEFPHTEFQKDPNAARRYFRSYWCKECTRVYQNERSRERSWAKARKDADTVIAVSKPIEELKLMQRWVESDVFLGRKTRIWLDHPDTQYSGSRPEGGPDPFYRPKF